MSLFHRDRSPVAEERAQVSLPQLAMLLAGSGNGPSASSVDEALRDSATWACVKVKAQGVAMLPVDVIDTSGGQRVRVPVQPKVIASPSAQVPRRIWLFQVATSLFTDGNAFGLVVGEANNRPSQIELLDPSSITRRDVVNGIKTIWVGEVAHQAWPYGDLWHIAGEMVLPGSPWGLSPIRYGSRSTGTSLAAEEFGGRFFSDGGHPSAIIRPDRDPGEDGARMLKAKIMEVVGGTSREPLVLPQSIEWQQISVNPSDSQFIDLLRFEVEQTCRRHGVPPSMVYAAVSGQNVTYANVSQADLHYLKHTLSYPIDLVEDALTDLVSRPKIVRLNRDAILRADTAGRYVAYETALRNRFATVNEVRTLEDMEPFGSDFDEPGIPPMVEPADDDSDEEMTPA